MSGYIVPIIFAMIFVLGVTGNAVLILIVLINKTMRTRPNIYIISLALGDLMLLLVSVPFFALTYTYPFWPLGLFVCKLIYFVKALSLGVSIYTLAALSVDRYLACLHPMRRHTHGASCRTPVIAGAIWFISFGLALFDAFCAVTADFKYKDGPPVYVCQSDPENAGPWFPCFRAWFRFTVYFLIPIIVITALYSLMAKSLWSNHDQVPQEAGIIHGPAAIRQTEARRKIAKIVLIIVILFIICWLPRHIYLLWFHCPSVGEFNCFWYIWKMVSYCLCFSSSCINPLVLYILSDQYRRYFNRYLCCQWRNEVETTRVLMRSGTWQMASISLRTNKRMSTDIQNGFHPHHHHTRL